MKVRQVPGGELQPFNAEDESGAGVTELTLPKVFGVFDKVIIKKGGSVVATDRGVIEETAQIIPSDSPFFTRRRNDESEVQLVVFCCRYNAEKPDDGTRQIFFERRGILKEPHGDVSQRIYSLRAYYGVEPGFMEVYDQERFSDRTIARVQMRKTSR